MSEQTGKRGEGRCSSLCRCIKQPPHLLIYTHSNPITKTVFLCLDLFVSFLRTGKETVPQCLAKSYRQRPSVRQNIQQGLSNTIHYSNDQGSYSNRSFVCGFLRQGTSEDELQCEFPLREGEQRQKIPNQLLHHRMTWASLYSPKKALSRRAAPDQTKREPGPRTQFMCADNYELVGKRGKKGHFRIPG